MHPRPDRAIQSLLFSYYYWTTMNTSLITKSQGKLRINQAQQGILQSMHPQRASGKHLFLISAVVFIPFFFFLHALSDQQLSLWFLEEGRFSTLISQAMRVRPGQGICGTAVFPWPLEMCLGENDGLLSGKRYAWQQAASSSSTWALCISLFTLHSAYTNVSENLHVCHSPQHIYLMESSLDVI